MGGYLENKYKIVCIISNLILNCGSLSLHHYISSYSDMRRINNFIKNSFRSTQVPIIEKYYLSILKKIILIFLLLTLFIN